MAAAIVDHQFLGWFDFGDQRHQAIGRGDGQIVVLRHHALGIAEEREHAKRQQQQRPANDFPVETDQEHKADQHRDDAELATFGMDRGP